MKKTDPEIEEKIVSLYSKGNTITYIATELSLACSSVLGILKRKGLWHRTISTPYTEKDIAAMAAVYNNTQSIWKTGEALNIPGQIVHKYLSQLGIIQNDFFTEEEIALIVEEYSKPFEEFSSANLVAKLNRPLSGIVRMAGKLGLTNKDRGKDKASKRFKEKINLPGRWKDGTHPKGMSGKIHSQETKDKISAHAKLNPESPEHAAARSKKAIATKITRYGAATIPTTNTYSRCKRGFRDDLGDGKIFFRSSWEANYARYLNLMVETKQILSWEFEKDTFIFPNQTKGPVSYLPDFKVILLDGSIEYREIKGWMDAKSKSKLKKFKKYYPEVSLVLIDSTQYKKIERTYKLLIPLWE